MEPAPTATPMALFVALTRAVREAALPEATRLGAYEALERMARVVYQPSFGRELDALLAAAAQAPALADALRPHLAALQALAAPSSERGAGLALLR